MRCPDMRVDAPAMRHECAAHFARARDATRFCKRAQMKVAREAALFFDVSITLIALYASIDDDAISSAVCFCRYRHDAP